MRKAFTLIELLVTVTIIGILAGLMFGVIGMAGEASKRAATKATITKLNSIVMERYESYLTRRVGFDTSEFYKMGLTPSQIATKIQEADTAARANPVVAARYRLDCLRDTMRMEMPDARSDIANGPIMFSWGNAPEPAIHKLYAKSMPTADHDSAQCLYLFVSRLCPAEMEHFSQKEIGLVDGKPCFIDGWGHPIMFLRWAPGYRSPIQSGDEKADHDPFDPRQVDGFAFRLVPLIYSAGPDGEYGIGLDTGAFGGNPYAADTLGKPLTTGVDADNITNHVIETR